MPIDMDAKDLYELTPDEFNRLIAALFAEMGYSDLCIIDGPMDKGIDIIGIRNKEQVGIQVKHKRHIGANEIKEFVSSYFSSPSNPRALIYVTSSEVPSNLDREIVEQLPPGYSFQLIGRRDILRMVDVHRDVANIFLKKVKERISSLRNRLSFGIIGVIVSIIASIMSFYSMHFFPRPPLDKRIQTVENALSSIRDLETYLGTIKQDMVETEKATQLLKQKYTQAKELEKLTQDQVNALKATLQAESWHRTIFNWAMGFILGVASSFLGGVFYARWRQSKALE